MGGTAHRTRWDRHPITGRTGTIPHQEDHQEEKAIGNRMKVAVYGTASVTTLILAAGAPFKFR